MADRDGRKELARLVLRCARSGVWPGQCPNRGSSRAALREHSELPSGVQLPGVTGRSVVKSRSGGPLRSAGIQEMPLLPSVETERKVTRLPSRVHAGEELSGPNVRRCKASPDSS